jgi:hypothetical protein
MTNLGRSFKAPASGISLPPDLPLPCQTRATVFVLMEEAPENAASDLQMQRDHPFLAWDRPKCYLDLGANRFKNWNSPLNVFGCALFSFSIKDAYFLSDSKLYIM